MGLSDSFVLSPALEVLGFAVAVGALVAVAAFLVAALGFAGASVFLALGAALTVLGFSAGVFALAAILTIFFVLALASPVFFLPLVAG